MALITFKLNDFGVASMANLSPRVYFEPDGPAVVATNPTDYLLASKRVRATLAPDGVTFSVNLFPSSWARPVTTFRMVVEWLDAAGNFISRDSPQWRIFIPEADSSLADLIDVPPTAFMAWIGPTPPEAPVVGAWWLNSVTGDLAEWGGDVSGWTLKTNLQGIQGIQGDQGLPGLNAVPTDEALAANVKNDVPTEFQAALRRRARPTGGLYLPTEYAGLRWRVVMSQVRSKLKQAHVAVLCDSIGSTGAPLSNPKYKHNWPGHLRRMLDGEFGPAGTGMVIMDWDIRATPAYDDRFVYSGPFTNAAYGWFQHAGQQMDAGASLVFTATASEFWVLNLSSASGANSAEIDGGLVDTFRNIGSGGPVVTHPREAGTHKNQILTHIPAGSLGAHTLRILPPAGTFASLLAVEGRIPTLGTIRVSNLGVSGVSLQSGVRANDEVNGHYGLPLVDVAKADLLLIPLGINDWNLRRPIADLKADLGALIARQMASGTNAGGGTKAAGDVMLVWNPQPDLLTLPAGSSPGPTWDEYREAYYEVADEYNVPLLDLGGRWKDFPTANAMGLFGDGIHVSDTGSADIAPAVRNAILNVA